jgi:hypothetical protein
MLGKAHCFDDLRLLEPGGSLCCSQSADSLRLLGAKESFMECRQQNPQIALVGRGRLGNERICACAFAKERGPYPLSNGTRKSVICSSLANQTYAQ